MVTHFQTTVSGDRWMPGYVFQQSLVNLLTERPGLRVCEVGAGANPALPLSQITDFRADYIVSDVSEQELSKAPVGYQKKIVDIMSLTPDLAGAFDVVATRTVMEHVPDPRAFHDNICSMLVPGGIAIHLFPTLFAVPFTANLLLPERIGGPLLRLLRTGRENEGSHGKFRPYYRWCRGPSARQIARLEGVGYQVRDYFAFYGHRYYRRVPPLDNAEQAVSRLLARHPIISLVCFAVVILQKP